MTHLSWIAQHLAACLALVVLFGLPGAALARLLRLGRTLPRVLLVPAAFTLGLALLTVLLAIVLTLGGSMRHLLVAHAAATAVLVAWALAVGRRRRTEPPRGPIPGACSSAPIEPWTLVAIGMCMLLAELVRTRLAFDTLFHLGLVRRLAELPHLEWDTLDRTAGAGLNPSYVVPAWQAAMAAVARATGLDAAVVVEGLALLLVGVAAFAMAGLGRVVSGRGAGEVAAVGAFALLRIFYPRRELEGDGISYAVLPGNVALDIILPLLLALAVLLAVRSDRVERRGLGALAAAATVLFVLLHANYAVYVAIVGVGVLAWTLLVGPSGRAARRGLGRAAAWLAIPGVLAFAALLPALVLLENFARAHEARASIQYFLSGEGAWQVVRPAHLYELSGMPGLLAIAVLLPLAAWHARGVARALIAGGALAVYAFAFVPPLLAALDASGSLTLGLRLPRLFGVLLVAAAGVAVPVVAGAIRERLRSASSRAQRVAWIAAPIATVVLVSVLYGYPRARQVPAEFGWNWPAVVGVLLLLLVLGLAIRAARRAYSEDRELLATDIVLGRDPLAAATAVLIVVVALAMLPSGAQSLRRAGWQAKQWVPARQADDLGCYAGIQGALAEVEPGSIILADPVTAYGIPALSPGYVVADFKTWNGATDDSPAQQRIERIATLWSSSEDDWDPSEFARLLHSENVDYLVAATGDTEAPIGSEDHNVYDSETVRDIVSQNPRVFTLVSEGPGANIAGPGKSRCRLHMWRVERDIDIIVTADVVGEITSSVANDPNSHARPPWESPLAASDSCNNSSDAARKSVEVEVGEIIRFRCAVTVDE